MTLGLYAKQHNFCGSTNGREITLNTRKFSKAQEKAVAKATNGKVTANSGATAFQKGDVYSDGGFCIECKTATKEQASFAIKRDWVDKLKEEAFASNKPYWALVFNFGGLRNSENLYIIDERLFKLLQQTLQQEESD